MKKILFIADPLEYLNLKFDTTYFLLLNCYDLNINSYFCLTSDVYSIGTIAYAQSRQLKIKHGVKDLYSSSDWFEYLTPIIKIELQQFDAVMVRNDPPFNMEYYYLTQILTIAERAGTKVYNNSFALRNFNEKLTILNFPDDITPTLVTKNKAVILKFIDIHKECVIKPIDLMGGRGVFKLTKEDSNLMVIIEAVSAYYTQTIIIQKFLTQVSEGDKRIFIINGSIIPYCLYRIPQVNQIRSNTAAGGSGIVKIIPSELMPLLLKIAKFLQQHNIIFAGLDVIADKINEINITSPTGTHQIYQDQGINIPLLILKNILN